MDKHTIIRLKQQGHSNRSIQKITGINRKTIARYWKEFTGQLDQLCNECGNVKEIQEAIVAPPRYDSSTRSSRKYTEEIDQKVTELLNQEVRKNALLGSHKQNITKVQIHETLVNSGFDISYSTIAHRVSEKLDKTKECFIKQRYEYGDRLEYDFGEVKLIIGNEKATTYHMAVLSSPAGDFRWAYLYKNQRKDVFMDSHVRFFEMVKGVYKEVVYDNMRNVVTKFIGRDQKQLNEDLIKMSIYYGFDINVTNCYSGNEKGYVEGSVKIIRNHVFATNYEFNTLADAQEYLESQLMKMNQDSRIEEEKQYLLPYKPKLELANITINNVNKYSFIQIENNFYSAPEYLVDKDVSVKSYFDKILIYSNNHFVCEHKKIDGFNQISIDITHYLKTFLRKPGAVKNSLALKNIPQLKTIYDKHFNTNPKKFIEILTENKEKDTDGLLKIFDEYTVLPPNVVPIDSVRGSRDIYLATRLQTIKYDVLRIRKGV